MISTNGHRMLARESKMDVSNGCDHARSLYLRDRASGRPFEMVIGCHKRYDCECPVCANIPVPGAPKETSNHIPPRISTTFEPMHGHAVYVSNTTYPDEDTSRCREIASPSGSRTRRLPNTFVIIRDLKRNPIEAIEKILVSCIYSIIAKIAMLFLFKI